VSQKPQSQKPKSNRPQSGRPQSGRPKTTRIEAWRIDLLRTAYEASMRDAVQFGGSLGVYSQHFADGLAAAMFFVGVMNEEQFRARVPGQIGPAPGRIDEIRRSLALGSADKKSVVGGRLDVVG
jgi:hypothetical protein